MADAIYPKGKEHLLKADIDFDTGTFKIVLVSSSYVYSSSHESLADITASYRLATSGALTTITTTNGTLNFDDPTISGLDSGETAAAYILYLDSGVEATSYLIAYKDSAPELPVSGSTGVSVLISINASGYFDL